MPLCLKHVICHAKFNCPVGVVAAAVVIVAAAVAEAAIAVAVALVVAVVEVLVLHALYNLESRAKCLEIYRLQTLVLIA